METNSKILFWTPRVLCILAILFVSMFALDSFEPGVPVSQQILAFLMHMIPSFVLILALVVAWKWELIGGIIVGTVGLATSPFVYSLNYNRTHSAGISFGIVCMVCMPFLVVGILFIWDHYHRKQNSKISG